MSIPALRFDNSFGFVIGWALVITADPIRFYRISGFSLDVNTPIFPNGMGIEDFMGWSRR
ncbi:hypothetical protein [Coleofasciculus sp. A1-SPW-01]|uniref:hypothetical protein n=1 Tax=Coleofasciculus sp. A1-SPW-01 TaxID=3070819 RepID=UPI0040631062